MYTNPADLFVSRNVDEFGRLVSFFCFLDVSRSLFLVPFYCFARLLESQDTPLNERVHVIHGQGGPDGSGKAKLRSVTTGSRQ